MEAEARHAESWRPVVGAERWLVSNLGRVWGPRGLMTLVPTTRGGYLRARVAGRWRLVHQLVLEAFVGPCPPGCESRHDNGDSADNALTNLLWGTKLENEADKRRHGTHENGQRRTCRRAGHLLEAPNLEAWAREHRGVRKCYSCHWALAMTKNVRRDHGEHLDRDAVAALMYSHLMHCAPPPTVADLRGRTQAPTARRALTTLDVVRTVFVPGQELDAAAVLLEAERLGVHISRNAAHTALARAVERGQAEKVGKGRFRRLAHA